LVHWFETLVQVQQAAATSAEFFDATARAVVDLVGLDRGMVLLREGDGWRIAAAAPSSGRPFSLTILDEVVRLRRTLFRNLDSASTSASLVGIDAVAAAPILDSGGEVMGAVYGARELQFGRDLPAISELEASVLQVLAAAAGAGLAREQERERAMRSRLQFEQFFTPKLADELARDPALLAGRERELTVLFSDVRSFSRLSARLGARRTFEMMQDVMDLQTARIRETDGVVVDYVGDGLLAMWNAPADQPDHAARACASAVAIQRGMPALSARWEGEAGQPLRLGIGIHTGPALVGNTGSNIKFKYGPMGETVNLASRVENATKALGVPVLLTEATRGRLPVSTPARRIGPVRLEGFDTPIDLSELHTGDVDGRWERSRSAYEAALECFEARRWQEACHLLAGLLGEGVYDTPSIQLLTRAAECLRQEPEQFDPAATIGKSA
jgi:adenylate cyclase